MAGIVCLLHKSRLCQDRLAGPLPPLPETNEVHYEVGRQEDLLIENIHRSWANHFATEWHLLTGEVSDPSSTMVAELIVLIQQARESLVVAMS
ncbi:MAG TPA: hypothetical protein VNH11_08335 [Pirellulales bacterium]|nr:hypothetical protein [Pirellulales bacterium]